MNESKKKILDMLADGKITAAEAAELLDALEEETAGNESAQRPPMKDKRGRKKTLRVDIKAGEEKENAKVKVNIPLSLVKALTPILKSGVIPESAKEQMEKQGFSVETITQIIDQVTDELEDSDEDIVNIDAGADGDGASIKVYVD